MYRVPTFGRYAPDRETGPRPAVFGALSLSRFSHDERGNVALTFGLMFFVMMGFIGASVDIGRMMLVRKQTQEAIDAGVLAGLRNYQDTGSKALAEAAALQTYTYAVQQSGRGTAAGTTGGNPLIKSDTIAFTLSADHTSMTVAPGLDVEIKVPFISVATIGFNQQNHTTGSIDSMYVLKKDGSENAIGKIAIGQNAGTNLEVSIMIDITGSMCESESTVGTGRCGASGVQKIDVVKQAVQGNPSTNTPGLLDILIWPDQSTYQSRVAIVPFSETVNLGTKTLATAARGTVLPGTSTTPGSTNYQFSSGRNTYTFPVSDTCVTERLGANAYNDVSPSAAPVGRYYSQYNGACPTKTAVIPLSSDTAALKSTVNSLSAGGGTAGQMGTAWAWYMLSPNFNSLWSAASAARPYSDLTAVTVKGTPLLRKIAVLLTDGDYNTQYCNGVNDGYINCNANNGTSQSQAGSLCTAMKAKGIEIFTIGAMVSSNAKAFLQSCATDANHYYDATSSAQITQAFQDIAYKLVPPVITH